MWGMFPSSMGFLDQEIRARHHQGKHGLMTLDLTPTLWEIFSSLESAKTKDGF